MWFLIWFISAILALAIDNESWRREFKIIHVVISATYIIIIILCLFVVLFTVISMLISMS